MANVGTDRKSWAEALRKKIAQLTNDEACSNAKVADESTAEPATKPPESPREFVERRMRELDEERKHSPD